MADLTAGVGDYCTTAHAQHKDILPNPRGTIYYEVFSTVATLTVWQCRGRWS